MKNDEYVTFQEVYVKQPDGTVNKLTILGGKIVKVEYNFPVVLADFIAMKLPWTKDEEA